MTAEIIGREEELGFLHSLLDSSGGLAAALLEGEAGIGKSTLWLAGVETARERGLRVLSSRPAEAEQRLAHVGLGDLFEGVLDDVLPALSPPRRRALEVALLVEEAGEVADPRTLGVAVRSALEALCAEGRVVVAIDDVQWLDPSSASALAFALRRLDEQSILLLLARRLGEGAETPALERAIQADRVERLLVGPLSLGAIHQLLQAHLALKLPRPTLLRVHETSGGNPFYAPGLSARTSTPRSRFVSQKRWRDWFAHASTSCRRQPESRCCSQRPWAVRPPSSSQAWTSPSACSIAPLPRA